MLELLTSDAFMGVVGMVLAMVVPVLLRVWLKERADAAEKLFQAGVDVAYGVVNDLKARTATKIDDKAAIALDAMRKYYAVNGKTMTPVDEEKAKLLFTAMHGHESAGSGVQP